MLCSRKLFATERRDAAVGGADHAVFPAAAPSAPAFAATRGVQRRSLAVGQVRVRAAIKASRSSKWHCDGHAEPLEPSWATR